MPRFTASSSASFGCFLPVHTFSSSSSIAVRTCTKLPSRTPRELEEVAAEIARNGGRARPLPFDVTDSAKARDAIAALPRLDILVNNAGLNRPQPFLDVDEATLDHLVALNVKAPFVVAQAAARHMVRDGGGVVVNVTSQMGHVGSERDRGALQRVPDGQQPRERRADGHVHAGFSADALDHRPGQGDRLGEGGVHLPVASNELATGHAVSPGEPGA